MNHASGEPDRERKPNLALIFQELITAIVRLRFHVQTAPDSEVFRRNAQDMIHSSRQDALRGGYSSPNVSMAAFAVVAFLDESVLTSNNPAFATWSRLPLQEELFGEHMAGETFFQYVQMLLRQPDSVETADVLEVFYLCVLLGYRGRYGSSGTGELRGIMETVVDKVRRVRGDDTALSPHWGLPKDAAPVPRRDAWVRRLVWAAAGAAGLALITFTWSELLLLSGNSGLRSIADQLR